MADFYFILFFFCKLQPRENNLNIQLSVSMQKSLFDFIQCSAVTDLGFPESNHGRSRERHAPGAPQSLPVSLPEPTLLPAASLVSCFPPDAS